MSGALAFVFEKKKPRDSIPGGLFVANNHVLKVGFRCLTVEPTHRVPDPQTTVGGNLGPVPRSLLIPFLCLSTI